MATRTLIQLINDVGIHLRLSDGTTYTTINQDQDAVFINSMINKAKDMVEGEELWNNQTAAVAFSSVVSTPTYDLSSGGIVTSGVVTNERSKMIKLDNGMPAFWDITNTAGRSRLRQRTRQWVELQQAVLPNVTQSIPVWFAIYQTGNGLTVSFPYTVGAIRNYRLNVYTPQDDLDASADVLVAPHRPVVFAAVALAAGERGEELGLDASTWWEQYNSALSQALVNNMETDPVLVAD